MSSVAPKTLVRLKVSTLKSDIGDRSGTNFKLLFSERKLYKPEMLEGSELFVRC